METCGLGLNDYQGFKLISIPPEMRFEIIQETMAWLNLLPPKNIKIADEFVEN